MSLSTELHTYTNNTHSLAPLQDLTPTLVKYKQCTMHAAKLGIKFL